MRVLRVLGVPQLVLVQRNPRNSSFSSHKVAQASQEDTGQYLSGEGTCVCVCVCMYVCILYICRGYRGLRQDTNASKLDLQLREVRESLTVTHKLVQSVNHQCVCVYVLIRSAPVHGKYGNVDH